MDKVEILCLFGCSDDTVIAEEGEDHDMKVLLPAVDQGLYQNRKDFPAEIVYEITTLADGLPFGLALADIQQSEAHFHKKTIEIYTVVQGTLEVYLDGQAHQLRTGDTIKIPTGVDHFARSLDDTPARLMIVCIPEWSQNDYFRLDNGAPVST